MADCTVRELAGNENVEKGSDNNKENQLAELTVLEVQRRKVVRIDTLFLLPPAVDIYTQRDQQQS